MVTKITFVENIDKCLISPKIKQSIKLEFKSLSLILKS